MRILCRSFLLIGTLVLAGCAPFPNMRYYAPSIVGVVMQDGKPVGGAEIRVSTAFSNEIRETTAAPNGRFKTESIRRLLLTSTLIGDPLYGYTVEIRSAGIVYKGFVDLSVGYAPSTISLNCDLSHPVGRIDHQVYCTVSDDRSSS